MQNAVGSAQRGLDLARRLPAREDEPQVPVPLGKRNNCLTARNTDRHLMDARHELRLCQAIDVIEATGRRGSAHQLVADDAEGAAALVEEVSADGLRPSSDSPLALTRIMSATVSLPLWRPETVTASVPSWSFAEKLPLVAGTIPRW